MRYPYRATFTAMFTLKHEKTLSIEESIVYMCAKDWNVIQLRRHWQLLETEFGPALLTNSDIFGVGRSKV